MTTQQTEQEASLTAQLEELGFKLECESPVGVVDGEGDEVWPCIRYWVTLTYQAEKSRPRSRRLEYSLGVGHVDWKRAQLGTTAQRWAQDEESLIRTAQRNPGATFKDKALWVRTAAKLARYQAVTPTLPSVLHSLLSDGEAYFNAQRFEEWARDLGFDPDSRKAEAIFKACDETGRWLASNVPADVLNKARELLGGY